MGPNADSLSLVFGCRVVLRSVQFGSEDVSSAQVAQERTTVTQREGETRTGRHFLNAGRLSESAGEQMSEAENFLLPVQVVWGLVGAKVRLPRPTNCANAPWRPLDAGAL